MSLAGRGFDSKCDFAPPTILLGVSPLPLDVGYLFLVGSNILLPMVVLQQVATLEFSQEKMTTCPSSLPFPLIGYYKMFSCLCYTVGTC